MFSSGLIHYRWLFSKCNYKLVARTVLSFFEGLHGGLKLLGKWKTNTRFFFDLQLGTNLVRPTLLNCSAPWLLPTQGFERPLRSSS